MRTSESHICSMFFPVFYLFQQCFFIIASKVSEVMAGVKLDGCCMIAPFLEICQENLGVLGFLKKIKIKNIMIKILILILINNISSIVFTRPWLEDCSRLDVSLDSSELL